MDHPHRVVVAAVAWAALAGTALLSLHVGEPNQARWQLLGLIGVAWAVFALAAWLLLRVPPRSAVPLLVGGGIVLQLVAMSAPPRMTDDYFRYVWDGRVQAAGVDPYRHAPTAPELRPLRDGWLFPDGQPRLNHPDDPTIYPPVAQAYFVGVHYGSPPGSRHKPWQVSAALLAAATTIALVRVLSRVGGDPRSAVLWAWCPTVVLEAGNNAHVDVVGALLLVLGLGALAKRRVGLGAGLLGAAVGVKLLPALVFPAVLRRRPLLVLGAATGVLVVAYLPHVLAVGPKVIGFLPGYLAQEGYAGAGRFALLRVVLADSAAPYVAAALFTAAALLVWRRCDPARPWNAAAPLVGVAFLLIGPSYPWYALMLIALVALGGRPEWLAVAAAGYPAYFAGALGIHHETMQRSSYGLALVIVVAAVLARNRGGPAPPVRQQPPLDVPLPASSPRPTTPTRSAAVARIRLLLAANDRRE